jgi:REase_AHJR-like
VDQKKLEQVAQQYRAEGYAVSVCPSPDAVPPFLSGFSVDLLATRGSDRVIVEVKRTRLDLSRDPTVIELGRRVNAEPGWRFDLVILEPTTEFDEALYDATEPTPDQVLSMLATAEELIEKGYLPSACITAWAGLEAAMRKVQPVSDANDRITTRELLQSLYSDGILTREQFDELRKSSKLRNQVAHGLVPTNLDKASIQVVTGIARDLLQNLQIAA